MALRCLYLGDGYLLKAIWQDISSLSFEYLSLRCSTLNAGLYPCSLTMLVRNIFYLKSHKNILSELNEKLLELGVIERAKYNNIKYR